MRQSSAATERGKISLNRQIAPIQCVHATFPQYDVTFHRCNVASPQYIAPFHQLIVIFILPFLTIGREDATPHRFSEAFDRGNASSGASKQRFGWCCARRRKSDTAVIRPSPACSVSIACFRKDRAARASR